MHERLSLENDLTDLAILFSIFWEFHQKVENLNYILV